MDKIIEFTKQFFDIKFWKFILVGIVNTLVGNGLQFVFFNFCSMNEWSSSAIGYIIGSVVSYFLNKYFTFKNSEKGWKPVLKFALNIAICYTIAYGIAIPVVKWLCNANSWTMFGWSVETFAGNFSMLVGACLFVAFNYIGQRFFAFKEKEQ
ncbi:MAG: GtrA family protein [Ruminococcus sp.]|nr:GtrA family protein [Ruminococcus sp.]